MSETTPDPGWYSDEAATFGDRVAAAREAVGISQGDLARRLGVKDKTIRAWEGDMAEPRANKLSMMSGVLNVTMRWLLTGEGSGVLPPDEVETIPPDIARMLAEMREIRGQTLALGERIGLLEKRLRAAWKAQSE